MSADCGAPTGIPSQPTQTTVRPRIVRTYEESMKYITKLTPNTWQIAPGFTPNQTVPGIFYVNHRLEALMLSELQQSCSSETGG